MEWTQKHLSFVILLALFSMYRVGFLVVPKNSMRKVQ